MAPGLPVPPYAAPALVGAAEGRGEAVALRAAPYVPAAWRQALGMPPVELPLRGEPVVGASEPAIKVPPYHPLRPTPIGVPAIRTSLYIPAFPTPGNEVAVEADGVIEPHLLTTADTAGPAEVSSVTPSTDHSALPWIDAFLAATPAASVSAIVEAPDSTGATLGHAPTSFTPVATPAIAEEALVDEPTPNVEQVADVAEIAAVGDGLDEQPVLAGDEWPLDEAATEFRAFSAQLDPTDPERAEPAAVPELHLPAPLPAWSDDDLMDIMPVRHSGKTPLSTAAIQPTDAELWSDRAQKAQEEAQVIRAMASAQAAVHSAAQAVPPEASAEEAAHALELLAQRVRAGELMLPSYDPRMGEPAALVAALAALLGVRLR